MKGLFIISGLGIFAMLAEIFKGLGLKKILHPVVLLGIIAAFVVNVKFEWNNNMSIKWFDNMIVFGWIVECQAVRKA